MLRRLDRAALHLLRQRAAGAELAARGELHVDLAVGHVLDVLLEVELHDRVAARGAQHVGRGDRHGVIGGLAALLLLLTRLRHGLVGEQRSAGQTDHGRRESVLAGNLEEAAALDLLGRAGVVSLRHRFLPQNWRLARRCGRSPRPPGSHAESRPPRR